MAWVQTLLVTSSYYYYYYYYYGQENCKVMIMMMMTAWMIKMTNVISHCLCHSCCNVCMMQVVEDCAVCVAGNISR